jgi:cell division protein FtsW (lipid II flippase)
MKNIINIIIFCIFGIFGIFLYVSRISYKNTEEKINFIIGYVVFMIILVYLLTKPSRKKKR